MISLADLRLFLNTSVTSLAITGAQATDTFTSNGHGLTNGKPVTLVNLTGGAGLVAGTTYWVIAATVNTFQLSLTQGGSAVNFTTDLTAGTLTHAAEDALLLQLEESAVSIVETWQGFRYPPAGTLIDFVRGNGTEKMLLTNPTADPTEVLERIHVGATGTAITGAQADGWVLRSPHLVRKAFSVWRWGFEYQVTYAGGYAPGTEPDNVRQAVKSIVATLFNARGVAGGGLTGETFGEYSYSLAEGTAAKDAQIKAILELLPRRVVLV